MRKGSISQIPEISESTCMFVYFICDHLCNMSYLKLFLFDWCRLYYKMSVYFEGLSLLAIELAAAAFTDALI